MDYNRIKTELEHKSMSIRDLCYKIDVTEQGLHQMIRNKSMKIEILERISYVLERPVSYWFEEGTDTESMLSNRSTDIVEFDKTDKNEANKMIHEKIDSLTKYLNEMLKEIVNK